MPENVGTSFGFSKVARYLEYGSFCYEKRLWLLQMFLKIKKNAYGSCRFFLKLRKKSPRAKLALFLIES